MILQGRELSQGMQGEDVKLLLQELQQLGYTISDEEIAGNLYGGDTVQAVMAFQEAHDLPVNGVVNKATATRINAALDSHQPQKYIVRGQIRLANGDPFVGALVRAFDKDMRSEELLGQVETDQNGNYVISYSHQQFQRAEKGRADLIIRVLNEQGLPQIESDIIFDAPPDHTINLVVGGGEYRGPSEYEQYITELTPVMQGVPPAELTEEDIAFLTDETGINKQHIEFIALAAQVGQKTKLPPQAFYGLFRRQLPTSLPILLTQEDDILQRALEAALRDNIIRLKLDNTDVASIEAVLARLRELRVEQAFAEPETPGKYSLGAILDTSQLSKDLQHKFVTAFTEHKGPAEDFWTKLHENPDFSELAGHVEELQFTLQLGGLTQNHLSLVQELRQQLPEAKPDSLRELARFDLSAWQELLKKEVNSQVIGVPPNIPGKDEEEKARNYAVQLAHSVEDTFPTAVVAYKLEQDGQFDIPAKDILIQFFKHNIDFDLGTTHIDKFMADQGEIVLEDVADLEDLTLGLKGLQRLYRISPHYERYEAMQVLHANGFESALAIARLDRSAFLNRYTETLGGRERAQTIYNNARQRSAMALALFGKYGAPFYSLPVIGEWSSNVAEIPNWSTLFGPPVLCECEHCRSVYGPAAYLVDLLEFLNEVGAKETDSGTVISTTAREMLFKRRPDIGEIELSCENTNTPLPYIDLVNEILEHLVSPFTEFNLDSARMADLNAENLSPEVREAFSGQDITLPQYAEITVIERDKQWVITGGTQAYRIRENGALTVSLDIQTRASAEELSANPEYINEAAYDILANKAVYPWDLPFSLWTEEARLYLKHLGVSRYQLMEIFQRSVTGPRPTDLAIIGESLGLSNLDSSIITGASLDTYFHPDPPPSAWEFWGYTDPADTITWVEDLGQVPAFLEKSKLSFKELLELEKAAFVAISVDNTACDLKKATITGLTETELSKIHRFIRLQRRLGWPINELDKTISALGTGDLNNEFLQRLADLQWLRSELKVPLVEMLSWWAPIDTADRYNGANSLYEKLFLNKTVLNPEDEIFLLNDTRDELRSVSGINLHVPAILAALGISADDLSRLRTIQLSRSNGLSGTYFENEDLTGSEATRIDGTVNFNWGLGSPHPSITATDGTFGARWTGQILPDFSETYTLYVRSDSGVRLWVDGRLLIDEWEDQPLTEHTATIALEAGQYYDLKLEYFHNGTSGEEGIIDLSWSSPSGAKEIIPHSKLFYNELNLANLSRLYRHVSLARALRLSIRNLLALKALSDINPFDITHTEDTRRFVEIVRKLQASAFSIAELDYLLRHVDQTPAAIAPSGQYVALLLKEIRAGLQKIAEENTFAPDPTGDLTSRKLALLLSSERVNEAMSILENNEERTPGPEADRQKDFIRDNFNKVLTNINEAQNRLVGPHTDFIPNKEERFEYVLKPLLDYLRDTQSKNLIIQKLAGTLALDVSIMEQMLMEQVLSPDPDTTEPSISEFTKPVFAEHAAEISEVEFEPDADLEPLFETFILLHKIAIIITKLNLTPKELRLIFHYYAEIGSLDLNTLPVDRTNSPVSFDGFEWLLDLIQLRDELPPGEPALFDMLKPLLDLDLTTAPPEDVTGIKETFFATLRRRTDWSETDLNFLVSTSGFDFSFPIDYFSKDKRALIRLKDCFDITKRLGVSAEEIWAWVDNQVSVEVARKIKQAAKAKYDDVHWLKIAKPLKDDLRDKQRSALVAYLVAKHSLRDSNDLYDYFLIDPEMDPCMITTRIKQANSTVQLFVQRCLMGLEPGILPSHDQVREWKWRKNYRVWEANRKVFLYPENWIEPELRGNKSPFFIDLENQLLQNEITADTAETAFLHYLEKLDEVARLEIAGMYHQLEENPDGGLNILHVFGRTRNTPHIYYYRRWVDQAYWTPWERVDLDVQGDHLIPVVWNRRLYLFWPIFTEKAEEGQIPEEGATTEDKKPNRYWEIQLAWSEYKSGKWSAKKLTTQKIATSHISNLPIKSRYSFWADFVGNDLLIGIDEQGRRGLPLSQFRFTGNDGRAEIALVRYTVITKPEGTDVEFNSLVEQTGEHPLELFTAGEIITEETTVVLGGVHVHIGGTTVVAAGFHVDYETEWLSQASSTTVLFKTPGAFKVVLPQQYRIFVSQAPFFYEDNTRTFFVTPREIEIPLLWYYQWVFISKLQFQFETFYHPYVYEFIKQLNRYGIDGLLNPASSEGLPELRRQQLSNQFFKDDYSPEIFTVPCPFPVEDIDFAYGGAYSLYNWELFFHAPLLIADRLSQNQRFEEAQHWFHYIFDPTDVVVSGLRATYFNNRNLTHPVAVTRIDPTIDFDWGDTSPDPCILSDNFSVRWTGRVMAQHSETYTFYTQTDDGVRLWVENQPLIDQWHDQPVTEHSATIELEAGKFYNIKMEYYERGGRAAARLLWESPSRPKEIIPQNQLFPGGQPYWKVRPLFEQSFEEKRIDDLMRLLSEGDAGLENQVAQWRDNPFDPHLIASLRYVAYQKAVVMKYIDNLIAWGDQLFHRDTIESTNEATQLYVMAAQILGPRPETSPPPGPVRFRTYNELTEPPGLDSFSNKLVEIENLVIGSSEAPTADGSGASPPVLYFCIPKNDKLLSYWDTVADRLFKIRHCMTIEGVVRQLPLFEPPIEPGLLVRAAAAGVDINSALNDVNAALPHYRFQFVLQKAIEFCGDVRALGSALLSALEKRDAEALALLRSGHELQLLNAVKQIKMQQIEEAKEALEGLRRSKLVTEERRNYYRDIPRIIPNEQLHMDNLEVAHILNETAQGIQAGVSAAHIVPQFDVGISGWAGSPVAKASFGGHNLGSALQAATGVLNMIAAQYTHEASMASIKGGYDRRWGEWKHQERLADKELVQLDKQIAAADIRLAIAEKDLENHETQIENAREVETFMREKFTNKELYDWMVGQISILYFQSYQMAYDLAKQAERAFQYELGEPESTFIQFGYWDSLKKGLLAGEKLHYDLKRMELSHHEKNKREYEITKHISLAILDPFALVKLKETGECFVNLPEAIFDLDHPGHYLRRIKSVSLTIPCVTGPYTGVNCTLTLLQNSVRTDPTVPDGVSSNYPRGDEDTAPDLRFRDNIGAIQSIATSSAQNDSGLFELNFRDERYLPFEGAGAISQWRIDLSGKWRTESGDILNLAQFDFDTITDIIFQIKYTARDGGESLKRLAVDALFEAVNGMEFPDKRTGLFRLFSLRHEFPNKWHHFLQGADLSIDLHIDKSRFPFFTQGDDIHLNDILVVLKPAGKASDGQGAVFNGISSSDLGGLDAYIINVDQTLPIEWQLIMDASSIPEGLQGEDPETLDPDKVEDIFLICRYRLEVKR